MSNLDYSHLILENVKPSSPQVWVSIVERSSMGEYQRPSGRLPMLDAGLKPEAKKRLEYLYGQVLKDAKDFLIPEN
jgi:hypothetical protein